MIITCNHCHKKLKGNDKLRASLEQLPPDQPLRLKCPHCGHVISLNRDFLISNQASEDPGDQSRSVQVSPPEPPDLNWLATSLHGARESSEAQALILMKDSEARTSLGTTLEELGFRPFFPASINEALERMRSGTYAVAILHSRHEGETLSDSTFHDFICSLNMHRRRTILYILVGPEFKTLYDLEALSLSANLTINEQELRVARTILRLALSQYHELFDPFLEELAADPNH